MRRTLLIFSLIGLLFLSNTQSFGEESAKGDEKYEDAKQALTDLAVVIEAFVENMSQVDQPQDVAKVLDTFADSMKELVPKINEAREKYPELKTEDTHPEELKPLLQRIDNDFQAMMKVYAKVKQHLEEPAVQEADAKYKEVMSGLR